MASIKDSFIKIASDKRYIQDTREIIKNKAFQQNTRDFFTIVPGIKGGQQVAAMEGFEYVTVKAAGCGGQGLSPEFPAFEQHWNPKRQEIKISYCYTDFEAYFTQWVLNNGYQVKDVGDTELGMFIQDLVTDAVSLDMQRIVLTGDEDIATQGILTDSASMAKFYNTIPKGLIPTLQYLKTFPDFADKFIPLSKNTEATKADQYNLGSEYALDLYEELTDQYDFDGDILLTSNRLFKNYVKWLKRANGYGLQSNIDDTVKGIREAQIDGESLVPVVNYDRWKGKDFVTDGKVHLPHFAIFTRKEHLQVGVDSEAALSDLTLEYIGGADERFWIKGNYMLDFKMTNPYALKAAL